MTDLPERIWAGRVDGYGVWWEAKDWVGQTEYTLTTLAKAAEEAAYRRGLEDAAKAVDQVYAEWTRGVPYANRNEAARAIRALIKEQGK